VGRVFRVVNYGITEHRELFEASAVGAHCGIQTRRCVDELPEWDCSRPASQRKQKILHFVKKLNEFFGSVHKCSVKMAAVAV
jgi:hypothetical protein